MAEDEILTSLSSLFQDFPQPELAPVAAEADGQERREQDLPISPHLFGGGSTNSVYHVLTDPSSKSPVPVIGVDPDCDVIFEVGREDKVTDSRFKHAAEASHKVLCSVVCEGLWLPGSVKAI
jgi:hypothetical protein